jgi:TetR/AcrR family transcriptional repressor of bet genes
MKRAVNRRRQGPIPRLKPNERRRQIVEATLQLMADRGFSATSVREIAQRADVSLGTLQHHFEGKAEIVFSCLQYMFDSWAYRAGRVLTTGEPPLKRLENLIDLVLGDPEADYLWRVYLAFAHETAYDRSLRRAADEAHQRWDGLLNATVQQAIDEGSLVGEADAIGRELSVVMNGVGVSLHGYPPRLTREAAITLCKKVLATHRSSRDKADPQSSGEETDARE